MTTAAEEGTRRVIAEHSTIGIVVTTDGSICGIEREKYLEPEQRVIEELQRINKPFVVLMNSAEPESDAAISAAAELEQKFGVSCLRVNCQTLDENDMCRIMRCVLEEFPVKSIGFYLPDWLDALGGDNKMKSALYDAIKMHCDGIRSIKDTHSAIKSIEELEFISSADVKSMELGNGDVTAVLTLPRGIFYQIVSDEAGVEINNDGELIKMLTVMAAVKTDYDSLRSALDAVRSSGYGVVMPLSGQVQLDEPQIVRQGGKYTVKLKARAPVIHMLMTDVETEVSPAIGGESASEDIINFLLQGFDGDVNQIWQSNIFGKSLDTIAEEGLTAKIEALPDSAKAKLRQTLQRIINEGSGGLICILL